MSKMHKKPSAFGKRLSEERAQRHWTQRRVAEELAKLHFAQTGEERQVNEEMIGRWERGDRQVSFYYRQLLCKLFDISVKEQIFLINKDYKILKENKAKEDV
jgi:transcriptional regulator with XRE-family HTH domain